MSERSNRIKAFFTNPRNVYLIGLVLGLLATTIELASHRATNFYVFRDATQHFWQGISPYTMEFTDQYHRFFLYSPVFNILFTPFAFLPPLIGGLLWNTLNYTLLFLAITNLPGRLKDHAAQIALYLTPIIVASLFCFQYNLVVCYIFVWAFILLEKNHPFWAVLLIMISATTKIYGGIELALLLCYPKVWRNIGYAAICGVVLLSLPILMTGIDGLVPWYMGWIDALTTHHDITGVYPSLIFAIPGILSHMRLFQAAVLLLLMVCFFALRKRWSDFNFRIQVLGILMGYIVLFSEASETHTYVIALTGYLMCWYVWKEHTLFDKIMFWVVFALLCVVPIDVLCPDAVHQLLNKTLCLNVYSFTIVWLAMIWKTLKESQTNPTNCDVSAI